MPLILDIDCVSVLLKRESIWVFDRVSSKIYALYSNCKEYKSNWDGSKSVFNVSFCKFVVLLIDRGIRCYLK